MVQRVAQQSDEMRPFWRIVPALSPNRRAIDSENGIKIYQGMEAIAKHKDTDFQDDNSYVMVQEAVVSPQHRSHSTTQVIALWAASAFRGV